MHDIPIQIPGNIGMFADDMVLIAQSTDLEDSIDLLQQSVDIVDKWLQKWCVRLNANKCECKIFTLRRIKNPTDGSIKY